MPAGSRRESGACDLEDVLARLGPAGVTLSLAAFFALHPPAAGLRPRTRPCPQAAVTTPCPRGHTGHNRVSWWVWGGQEQEEEEEEEIF
jgi:hypothetical protein